MLNLTAQYLVNIIAFEMEMPKNSIWIRNQNRLIPNDTDLYIVVGMVTARTTANNCYMEQRGVEPDLEQWQINQVNQDESIQIDIFSRSNEALKRTWEVIAALQSFYSQQVQEANNFKIYRIPQTFTDTAEAEGGSMLNRYSIVINASVWYRKEKVLTSPLGDYYDDFETRVDDENSIGTPDPIVEFEINSGGIEP